MYITIQLRNIQIQKFQIFKRTVIKSVFVYKSFQYGTFAQSRFLSSLIRDSSIPHCSSDIKNVTIRDSILSQMHARPENIAHWNSMRLSKSEAYLLFSILILSRLLFRKTSKKRFCHQDHLSPFVFIFVSFAGLAKFLLSFSFVLWKFYLLSSI